MKNAKFVLSQGLSESQEDELKQRGANFGINFSKLATSVALVIMLVVVVVIGRYLVSDPGVHRLWHNQVKQIGKLFKFGPGKLNPPVFRRLVP